MVPFISTPTVPKLFREYLTLNDKDFHNKFINERVILSKLGSCVQVASHAESVFESSEAVVAVTFWRLGNLMDPAVFGKYLNNVNINKVFKKNTYPLLFPLV